jgi:hypothetical protein
VPVAFCVAVTLGAGALVMRSMPREAVER